MAHHRQFPQRPPQPHIPHTHTPVDISVDDIISKLTTNKVFLSITPNHFLQSSHVPQNNMWIPPSVLLKNYVSSPTERPSTNGAVADALSVAPQKIHAIFNTVALAIGTHANDKWIKQYLRTQNIRSIIQDICTEFQVTLFVLFQDKGFAIEVLGGSGGDSYENAAVIALQPHVALIKKKDARDAILAHLASIPAMVPSDAKTWKKAKVADLRELCSKFGVSIDAVDPQSGKSKKKLKDELVSDLDTYFKKLNTTLFA